MKISKVIANTRKKAFEILVGGREYAFPYAKLRLVPSPTNPVAEAFPDPELGEEAFTYRLVSGEEDSIHLDAVLEVNKDPEYLQELVLHKLTIEALKGVEESKLGKRQIARQLGTSASQLYRLLDPENTGKSVGQMLALLYLVDRDFDLRIYPKSSSGQKSVDVFEIYKDKSGDYRFRLKRHDGRIVLSSDAYKTMETCKRALHKVRNYAVNDAFIERTITKSGRFRFEIKAKNHHVIARSPSFKSAARRDSALAMVRRNATELEIDLIGT
jgi:uncharacterized protein YegP (UPF0339 family)